MYPVIFVAKKASVGKDLFSFGLSVGESETDSFLCLRKMLKGILCVREFQISFETDDSITREPTKQSHSLHY